MQRASRSLQPQLQPACPCQQTLCLSSPLPYCLCFPHLFWSLCAGPRHTKPFLLFFAKPALISLHPPHPKPYRIAMGTQTAFSSHVVALHPETRLPVLLNSSAASILLFLLHFSLPTPPGWQERNTYTHQKNATLLQDPPQDITGVYNSQDGQRLNLAQVPQDWDSSMPSELLVS